jgi:hydroxymethylglutaryl-CoA reductase (NADPH)
MGTSSSRSSRAVQLMNEKFNIAELIKKIKEKSADGIQHDRFPIEAMASAEGQSLRLDYLEKETGKTLPLLAGKKTFNDTNILEGNIENYIGMTQVPTGIIGPLKVLGTMAAGDFFVPLATSEGALVASYHRGAKATRLCGGVTSICLVEAVQRSPVFKFKNIGELGTFLLWLLPQIEVMKGITERVSRYAKLLDVIPNIEGNNLMLTFEYQTGDASGQNMVTICTDEICNYLIANTPVQPGAWFIEGNYSGDKKATALSFTSVRGKKVTAEVELTKEVVEKVLKTTPKLLADYWQTSTVGIIQSGAIGAQGHFANGIAAMFLATGQDVACVSEAAVGITRMEVTSTGNLYASATLPSLILGTVGGGTSLPTQKECLELMDCYGPGKARKLAEICGALVLSGELSIAAALSAGHFSSAHKKFGRKK